MANEKAIQKRVNRIYKENNRKPHTIRFFEDFSEGLSISLGDTSKRDDFITVEPKDSLLLQLLQKKYHSNLSFELERTIGCAIYSLLNYGIAYIYIKAEYDTITHEGGEREDIIESLELGEIRGLVTKKDNENIEFWAINFNGQIKNHTINRDGLVILNLKDLGYSKKHFKIMAKYLDKYGLPSDFINLMNVDGYSFKYHATQNSIKQLKISKELGWINNVDELSDSHILYRRIKKNVFKMSVLNYVVEEINNQLSYILSNSESRLVVNYKVQNYNNLWEQFKTGKITISELNESIN